jgi:hypothetical protein
VAELGHRFLGEQPQVRFRFHDQDASHGGQHARCAWEAGILPV